MYGYRCGYRSEESVIDAIYPCRLVPDATGIINKPLPVGHIVIEFSFICDAVVEIVDNSFAFLNTLQVIALISQASFVFVYAFAFLEAVDEGARVSTVGIAQNAYFSSEVPSPWNWFLKLNCPL